jgi:hypothetical protein
MSSKPIPPVNGALNGMRIVAPSRVKPQEKPFDEALLLMANGHWQASFDRLAVLAESGHAQAARIALLFVKRGTSLFGGTYQATPGQRNCWQRVSD